MRKSLPLSSVDRLPNVCAIYFVLDSQGVVLYVGATKALRRRWGGSGNHHHRRQAFNDLGAVTIEWEVVPSRQLVACEQKAIRDLRPVLNSPTAPYRYNTKGGSSIAAQIYFPKSVLNELRRWAKANRRTLTAETVVAVEDYILKMRAASKTGEPTTALEERVKAEKNGRAGR